MYSPSLSRRLRGREGERVGKEKGEREREGREKGEGETGGGEGVNYKCR
jgi:hypothetical protein